MVPPKPPPQPITPITPPNARIASRSGHLRRLRGTISKTSSASTVLPAGSHTGFLLLAVDGAIVVTVSVEFCAASPLMVKASGFRLHCGGSTRFTILEATAQLRLTVPAKPFVPTTPIVTVLPVVAPAAMEMDFVPAPEPAKPGAAVMLRAISVVAVRVPEVPRMVTTAAVVVAGAAAATVNVTICVPAEDPAAKEAVTPLGRPLAVKETCPRNPPDPVIETVLLAVPPGVIDNDDEEAVSVKAGSTVMLRAICVFEDRVPEVPRMVTTAEEVVAGVEAATVNVTTCDPGADPARKVAVTPLGRPLAVKETCPENPPDPVTEIVLLAVPPGVIDNDNGEAVSVKAGWTLTLRAICVFDVRVPEVPRIVTTAAVVVACTEAAAVNVTTCDPGADPARKDAVTPLGRPLAVKATCPANSPDPVTEIALLAVPPGVIDNDNGEAVSVKAGWTLTLRAICVLDVRVPEVPRIVTTAAVVVACTEAAAVNVTTCDPGADPARKDAVTPLGRPLAVKATCPANPPDPVTEIVLLTLPPGVIDNDNGEAVSVKARLSDRNDGRFERR